MLTGKLPVVTVSASRFLPFFNHAFQSSSSRTDNSRHPQIPPILKNLKNPLDSPLAGRAKPCIMMKLHTGDQQNRIPI